MICNLQLHMWMEPASAGLTYASTAALNLI
jgi:hypothetical protein